MVLPLYMYYHCTCTTTVHVLPLYMHMYYHCTYYHCTCTTTVHLLPLYMYYHCTYYHCTCTTTVHVLSYHQSVMIVTCLITSSWAMYKMFKNDCQATANVILAMPIRSLLHWGICPTFTMATRTYIKLDTLCFSLVFFLYRSSLIYLGHTVPLLLYWKNTLKAITCKT